MVNGSVASLEPPLECLDLRSVGSGDPTEGWRELMSRTYVPFDARAEPEPGERFDASISRLSLGDAALVDYACGRGRGRRGRREISATPRDLIGVLFLREGRLGLTLDGQSMLLSPGQIVLWDGGAPGSFDALGPIAKRTLVVPRERLQAAFPRLASVLGRVLPADTGAFRLLAGYLDSVAALGGELDSVGRAAAGDAAVELVRVALGAQAPDDRSRLRDVILVQARRYVDAHLGEETLGPQRIADAHAVSVRTLHEAFEGTGESVGSLIRRRRLERCHADLADGGDTSVATIAVRWGFASMSHFSRAFRRHYGVSPSEVRAHGQRRRAGGQDAGVGRP